MKFATLALLGVVAAGKPEEMPEPPKIDIDKKKLATAWDETVSWAKRHQKAS